MTASPRLALTLLFFSASFGSAVAAGLPDFTTWDKVADPPFAGMDGVVDSATQITLTADATGGTIPAGVDIGFQSVDGADVASSTTGYYFPIEESFEVAVDFDLSAAGSQGLGVIGIGVGEDRDGANSAGVALAFVNGTPFLFSGAARTLDFTSPPQPLLGVPPSASGRLFVSYDHLTGNISYGASTTQGAAASMDSGEFQMRQNEWNDSDLLVSLFLRSDQESPLGPLSDGIATAVFSNFEVLSGSARAIPEPGTAVLLGAALSLLAVRTRT